MTWNMSGYWGKPVWDTTALLWPCSHVPGRRHGERQSHRLCSHGFSRKLNFYLKLSLGMLSFYFRPWRRKRQNSREVPGSSTAKPPRGKSADNAQLPGAALPTSPLPQASLCFYGTDTSPTPKLGCWCTHCSPGPAAILASAVFGVRRQPGWLAACLLALLLGGSGRHWAAPQAP